MTMGSPDAAATDGIANGAHHLPVTPMNAYGALLVDGTLDYDPAQERAMERLQALYQTLATYQPSGAAPRGLFTFFSAGPRVAADAPKGLYLCGGVGRGKSMLMDLFYDSVRIEAKRRVHFHAFMIQIHGLIREWRALDGAAKRRRLRDLGLPGSVGDDPIPPVARQISKAATLLCFDELQVTDVADAMILGRFFAALFDDGVIVVSTSNRAPGALYQGGINRELFQPFITLILERMEVVHLDGVRDYRLQRLAGKPVYHAPLDAVAQARMNETWRALTDMDRGLPCEIEVQGRRVPVPQAARGVARFSFADLCERPLGSADYLGIATRFHTVLVDAIPRMGPDKRNEARRFVTLIDALYENKVTLVASADAEPEALYPSGDGSFEFERTASRLMEMQSADYLDRLVAR
ncbi:MAG: cell division protein ZapE [Alphaproteobacteria bacterium]